MTCSFTGIKIPISCCPCWHCSLNRVIDGIYKRLDKIEKELKEKNGEV